jgi:hypothetical protein
MEPFRQFRPATGVFHFQPGRYPGGKNSTKHNNICHIKILRIIIVSMILAGQDV